MRAIPLHVPLITSPKYALARNSEDSHDKLPTVDDVAPMSETDNNDVAGSSGKNSTIDEARNESGSDGNSGTKEDWGNSMYL